MVKALIDTLNFRWAAVLAVLLFCSQIGRGQDFRLEFQNDPSKDEFGQISLSFPDSLGSKLSSLEWSQTEFKGLLSIYVGAQVPQDPGIPPIAGKYTWENTVLLFRPRFDPPPGIAYTAKLNVDLIYHSLKIPLPENTSQWTMTTFRVPEASMSNSPEVTGIYPSGDAVPANLLRIYLHFSTPMGLDNPHHHLHLLNSMGEEIGTPFVEVPEGLWDENRTRLTLFLHPGRVKRGVGPNLTMGEILESGESVQLVIDPDWKDALGVPLGQKISKTWQVTPSIRGKITPENWLVKVPNKGTQEPVVVRTDRILDHALTTRLIRIRYGEKHMSTSFEFRSSEQELVIWPDEPWPAGTYRLEIDEKLEDLSGNTVHRLFDTKTNLEESVKASTPGSVYLKIEIQ